MSWRARSGRAWVRENRRVQHKDGSLKVRERLTHLDKLDDLMPENLEQLDVLWDPSELPDGLVSLLKLLALALIELLPIRISLAILVLSALSILSDILTILLSVPSPYPSLSLLWLLLLLILLTLPTTNPHSSDFLRQTLSSLLLALLLLLGRLVLGFPSGVRGQSVDEGDDDLLDVDARVEEGSGGKEGGEGEEMELVGEDL
jgi:hypothetical protein